MWDQEERLLKNMDAAWVLYQQTVNQSEDPASRTVKVETLDQARSKVQEATRQLKAAAGTMGVQGRLQKHQARYQHMMEEAKLAGECPFPESEQRQFENRPSRTPCAFGHGVG